MTIVTLKRMHFRTSVCDLDLYSRLQGHRNAKILSSLSSKAPLISTTCGMLLEHATLMVLAFIFIGIRISQGDITLTSLCYFLDFPISLENFYVDLFMPEFLSCLYTCWRPKSRVPDQNGISKTCYTVEMYHSGREPSKYRHYIV